MALSLVNNPYSYYPDPDTGRPIFYGNIYIGNLGFDPEIEGNQKQVFVRQEDGTVIEVGLPIKTNAGGQATFQGALVQILTDGLYSMSLTNRNNKLVFYTPDALNGTTIQDQIDAIEAEIDSLTAPSLDEAAATSWGGASNVTTLSRRAGWQATVVGPKGGADYHKDTTTGPSGIYADGSGFFDLDGIGYSLDKYLVKNSCMFGSVPGDDSIDDTPAIQLAIDYGQQLAEPEGVFAVESLSWRDDTNIYGAGMGKTIYKQVLIALPAGRFSLFEPDDTYTNVQISDMTLDGNYTANNAAGKYAGVSGDGAINGIRIANVADSKFIRLDIKDFLTDAIYWGKISSANNVTPTNCDVTGCRITGRRNGIVISQADGWSITDTYIYDVGTVSPFSAIDIEPFEDADMKNGIIDNVVIQNCVRGIGCVTKAPGNVGWTYGENVQISNVRMQLTGESGITVHGVNDVKIENVLIDHATPIGGTNTSSVLISQTRRTDVVNLTSTNADFAGVRVLDAFVGDLNHVDTVVSLSTINVVNPRRHGVCIGNETGAIIGNQIDAKLHNITANSGGNTDGTGYGFMLGDINPNYISMTTCSETGTAFAKSLYLDYSSTVYLPLVACDLESVFATDDVDVIEGITQANPAVVTATAHTFTNGDEVFIKDVEGMTEVNGNIYTVANTAANTFELSGTNSTGFTAYTANGRINTSQPVFDHVTCAATILRELTSTSNPNFGGRLSTFNSSGTEAVRIDGAKNAVRFMTETVLADVNNGSIYVSSVDSKLKYRDSGGLENDLY